MLSTQDFKPLAGGCDCKKVRYELLQRPIYVHCCHCRWCQRETGSAFALNAMMEAKNVQHTTSTAPEMVSLPSESGKPQVVARCPDCKIALWSNYGGGADVLRFVKVGSLDDPDRCPPDIHIFTASKQPWIKLNEDVPAFEKYYDQTQVWPKHSLERLEKVIAEFKADKAREEELVKKTESVRL